jgi:hypothetical protein
MRWPDVVQAVRHREVLGLWADDYDLWPRGSQDLGDQLCLKAHCISPRSCTEVARRGESLDKELFKILDSPARIICGLVILMVGDVPT